MDSFAPIITVCVMAVWNRARSKLRTCYQADARDDARDDHKIENTLTSRGTIYKKYLIKSFQKQITRTMKHLYLLAALTVAFAPYGTYKDMLWHV
jgi:hypothetical protein